MIHWLLAGLLVILGHTAAPLAAQDFRLAVGASQFISDHRMGESLGRITVWTHRPKELAPNAPVLFVMHGMQRNGRHYRDQWRPYTERANALLLVPEFSEVNFPGAGYSAAKLDTASDGTGATAAIYTVIEEIFDRVKAFAGIETPDYGIYGHSAGAQFVHRLVMLNRRARLKVALAANAGWYMMPDFAVSFPYGLKDSGITAADLKEAFARELIVLLGDDDNDPRHPSLNRGARQMRQGPHRLARGQKFFHTAQDTAAKLNTPFAWKLSTVAGAGHDNGKMAPAAVTWLMR